MLNDIRFILDQINTGVTRNQNIEDQKTMLDYRDFLRKNPTTEVDPRDFQRVENFNAALPELEKIRTLGFTEQAQPELDRFYKQYENVTGSPDPRFMADQASRDELVKAGVSIPNMDNPVASAKVQEFIKRGQITGALSPEERRFAPLIDQFGEKALSEVMTQGRSERKTAADFAYDAELGDFNRLAGQTYESVTKGQLSPADARSFLQEEAGFRKIRPQDQNFTIDNFTKALDQPTGEETREINVSGVRKKVLGQKTVGGGFKKIDDAEYKPKQGGDGGTGGGIGQYAVLASWIDANGAPAQKEFDVRKPEDRAMLSSLYNAKQGKQGYVRINAAGKGAEKYGFKAEKLVEKQDPWSFDTPASPTAKPQISREEAIAELKRRGVM